MIPTDLVKVLNHLIQKKLNMKLDILIRPSNFGDYKLNTKITANAIIKMVLSYQFYSSKTNTLDKWTLILELLLIKA